MFDVFEDEFVLFIGVPPSVQFGLLNLNI